MPPHGICCPGLSSEEKIYSVSHKTGIELHSFKMQLVEERLLCPPGCALLEEMPNAQKTTVHLHSFLGSGTKLQIILKRHLQKYILKKDCIVLVSVSTDRDFANSESYEVSLHCLCAAVPVPMYKVSVPKILLCFQRLSQRWRNCLSSQSSFTLRWLLPPMKLLPCSAGSPTFACHCTGLCNEEREAAGKLLHWRAPPGLARPSCLAGGMCWIACVPGGLCAHRSPGQSGRREGAIQRAEDVLLIRATTSKLFSVPMNISLAINT